MKIERRNKISISYRILHRIESISIVNSELTKTIGVKFNRKKHGLESYKKSWGHKELTSKSLTTRRNNEY